MINLIELGFTVTEDTREPKTSETFETLFIIFRDDSKNRRERRGVQREKQQPSAIPSVLCG
jgi:hypothetical protein